MQGNDQRQRSPSEIAQIAPGGIVFVVVLMLIVVAYALYAVTTGQHLGPDITVPAPALTDTPAPTATPKVFSGQQDHIILGEAYDRKSDGSLVIVHQKDSFAPKDSLAYLISPAVPIDQVVIRCTILTDLDTRRYTMLA